MLEQIKNVEGTKNLSKSEQQQISGGAHTSPVPVYYCSGDEIAINATCPRGYQMHPQGHCLCCSTRWRKR
ncbi:hypothetical protein [Kordia sp.]|uniref:hypothetical protein n=1 Tax=Kordia sp. TaxID=1965332 RepID=UPI003B5A8834